MPGGAGAATTVVAAPVDSVSFGNAGAFPSMDVVSWGGSVASASASPGQLATANASSEVTSLSLFQGEVTATAVRGSAQAKASASSTSGDFNGAGVGSLVVNGQPAAIGPNARVDLGTWGYAIVLAQGSAPAERSYRGNITALDIRLTAEHGGLPAGTQILVGYAEVSVTAPDATTTHDLDGRSARPVRGEGPEVEAVAGGAHRDPAADPPAAGRRQAEAHAWPLRLPGLRPVVVHEHVRRPARGHRLAPRRGHLLVTRRAAARRRRRDALLGGLERRRRLSALAARHAGQPVLLRAPLRLLSARAERCAR